jgi:hypothetical protein
MPRANFLPKVVTYVDGVPWRRMYAANTGWFRRSAPRYIPRGLTTRAMDAAIHHLLGGFLQRWKHGLAVIGSFRHGGEGTRGRCL